MILRATLCAVFSLISTVCAVQAETMRLAVTTSFHNSGLAEVLLPQIQEDTGIELQLLVVGTGQALKLGQAGDVDAILVHSRAAEEAFVADGYGTHRREIMYNDFVLIGPAEDPAGVTGAVTVAEALQRIAEAKPLFVSRGDDSGTHRRELSLWAAAGVDVAEAAPDWYRAAGAGMGATLNTAVGMGAYVLSDRATWLKFGNKGDQAILFEGDDALFNQYAYLPVSPEKHPHVAHDRAVRVEAWLTGPEGQRMIGDYQIAGTQLFVPNASAAE